MTNKYSMGSIPITLIKNEYNHKYACNVQLYTVDKLIEFWADLKTSRKERRRLSLAIEYHISDYIKEPCKTRYEFFDDLETFRKEGGLEMELKK